MVDAFTDSAFKGNPAAVCLLDEERNEKWLQAVAAEFNIAETCYLIRVNDSDHVTSNPRFHLRWFTPVAEVKLCGHATLAAAHVLFSTGLVNSSTVEFLTLSGILTAKKVLEKTEVSSAKNGEANDSFLIELDFPAISTTENNNDGDLVLVSEALNGAPIIDIRTTAADDLFVVLPSSKDVAEFQPQFDDICKCPGSGIIVSAAAPAESGFDFYSRVFWPKLGIDEDPVCGSAHCALAHYWNKKLGKSDFMAFQASPRTGILGIHLDEQTQRVLLRGKAITVMMGISIHQPFGRTEIKYSNSLKKIRTLAVRAVHKSFPMDHAPVAPQSCVLKMNVKCEGCRKKVMKQLLRFQGVHSFDINANEGKVTISSTIDPHELIKEIAKLGKKVELLLLDDQGANSINQNNNVNNAAQNVKKVAPPRPRYAASNGYDQFDPYHLAQLQRMGNNQRLKQVELTHSRNIKMTFNDHAGDLMHEGHTAAINMGNGHDCTSGPYATDGSGSGSSSPCGNGGGGCDAGKNSASPCCHESGFSSEGRYEEQASRPLWPPNYVPPQGPPTTPVPNYDPSYGGPLPNPYAPQTDGHFDYKQGTCRLM